MIEGLPALLVGLPLLVAALVFVRLLPGGPAALGTALLLVAGALGLAVELVRAGEWLLRTPGGWPAPLGIRWQVDGLAAAMLAMMAGVGLAGVVYARTYLPSRLPHAERHFHALWLVAWSAMNSLFMAGDLFNIYVGLEFMALAAVALIALSREAEALQAAMRYFLATLLGSMLYLLGVALLYGQYGVLDQAALAEGFEVDAPGRVAAVAITLGLLMKMALFPLHFWLPAAHGKAPAPVSALLSGVVVAVSFYLVLRLWSGVFAPLLTSATATLLGILGVASMVWGGLQALRQQRLKMIVAYSTIAQFGLVMLVFPLFWADGGRELAWPGGTVMVLAHGLAKAALFFAAGCLLHLHGHDRIGELPGPCGREGWVWFAFALGSASLIGIPPTGGFLGKWQLLQAAMAGEAWSWAALVVGGSLLTAAYLYRPLEIAWRSPPRGEAAACGHLPGGLVGVAVACAVAATLLGFLVAPLTALLEATAAPLPPVAGG